MFRTDPRNEPSDTPIKSEGEKIPPEAPDPSVNEVANILAKTNASARYQVILLYKALVIVS